MLIFIGLPFIFISRDGDVYSALCDCHRAVLLDPTHSKAFYRQARCLFELRWFEEAEACLKLFKHHFPEQADGYSTKKLEMDIVFTMQSSQEGEREFLARKILHV